MPGFRGKKINERGNLEDPEADWGIILKYISKTRVGRTYTALFGSK